MDGSDDLGFDDEIEINEDDDGKFAKMEISMHDKHCLHSTTTVRTALHQPWTCRRGTKRMIMYRISINMSGKKKKNFLM